MGPVLLENESTLRESQETADNARHYKCTNAKDRLDISKNSWGPLWDELPDPLLPDPGVDKPPA